MQGSPLLESSDKSFWHGFVDFYDRILPREVAGPIVEFGVFHGHSIRWLLQKFPGADILGVDILAVQPEWPVDERVRYFRVDQADESSVANFFQEIPSPGLIIEDGSHMPSHQARCLRLGLDRLLPGGVYVLEDIHSSHPTHELFHEEFVPTASENAARPQPTVLSLLLCLEHLLRSGQPFGEQHIQQFASPAFMSATELKKIAARVSGVKFFKRCTLPSRCYACNDSDFDYVNFRCRCGVDLMKVADSMTVVLEC